MAPSEKQIRVITQKLENLKTGKESFLSLFKSADSHINKVISLGETWIKKGDISGASFSDIRMTLEKAFTYLFDVTEEITGLLETQNTTSAMQCSVDLQSPLTSQSFSGLDSSAVSSSVAASLEKCVLSLEERMDALENEGNKFNRKMQVTEARIGELNITLSEMKDKITNLETEKGAAENKIKRMEENIQRTDNMNVYTESLEGRLDSFETGLIRMKKLEDRLQQTEVQRKKDLDIIEEMKLQVASVTSKLDTKQSKRCPSIGFKACTFSSTFLIEKLLIKFDHLVASNPVNAYNSTTGIFTAPIDGLFEVKLTLQYQNDCLDFNMHILQVIHEPVGADPTENKKLEIGGVVISHIETNNHMELKIQMCPGDKLYVRVINSTGQKEIFSTFSCFLIG